MIIKIVLKLREFLRENNSIRNIWRRVFSVIVQLDYFLSSRKTEYFEFDVTGESIFLYICRSKLTPEEKSILDKLKQNGFVVNLVTEFEEQVSNDIKVIQKLKGRDFVAYRDFLAYLEKNRSGKYTEILMMNDSMIWSNQNFEIMLKKLRLSKFNEIVFPTDSVDPTYHVQPYLIYAKTDLFTIKQLSSAFKYVRNVSLKITHVYKHELKLAESLLKNYVYFSIMAPIDEVKKLCTDSKIHSMHCLKTEFQRMNTTHHEWDLLPFFSIYGVKKLLIKNNPRRVKNIPNNLEEALNFINGRFSN